MDDALTSPRAARGAVAPPPGSTIALVALVSLVVLSPWHFGSVPLRTVQVLTLVALAISLVSSVRPLATSGPSLPRELAWPSLALWSLAGLQLVPLPGPLHAWLAPGSAAIWHPAELAATRVLGEGPHPVSVFPDATARAMTFATGIAALAFLAAPALGDRRRALRASMVVAAGGLGVALYGLVAPLFCPNTLFCVYSVPTAAPFGPFVSKNHYAGYVEMAALVALGIATGLADEARTRPGALSWIDSPRAARVMLAWTVPAVLVLAVPVSLSRGGVVSLATGLVAFVWMRTERGIRSRKGLVVVAALALGVAAVAVVLPASARARLTTLAGTSPDASRSYRLAVWKDSLRLLGSSPVVGSGFGAYEDAIASLKTAAGAERVEHAENDYLEALGEGGVAGGLLVGLIAWIVLRRGWRAVRDEPHRAPRALRTGALGAMIALLVHSAFDFNLRIPSNALLFAILAALVLAPVASPAPVARSSGSVSAVVLAASLVLALATPWAERVPEGDLARLAAARPGGLRWSAIETDVVSHVRRRPADAVAWVTLAWLRRPSSTEEARALARWGAALDPTREALVRAARGL
jgi:O-antigen ligase